MEAFVDRKWIHGKSAEDIRKSITHGYADAGMPAWGNTLTENEIGELVDYILQGIERVEVYGFQEEPFNEEKLKTSLINFELDTVFSGIEVPWDMAWLPDGDMLVTERSGKLYRVGEQGKAIEIEGVPAVRTKDQDGLFDVLLHPDFANNHWLYLSYAKLKIENGDSITTTQISRFTLRNNQLTAQKVLLEASPYTNKQFHFGGRMLFDNKGYLYITVGDRGEQEVNPQDLGRVAGKIHRIMDDGQIPPDNPFANDKKRDCIYLFLWSPQSSRHSHTPVYPGNMGPRTRSPGWR